MYGSFEGKMCTAAIVGKCASNFTYIQNPEGSIFICGVAGTWRIVCEVSCEILSTSKTVICHTRISIGPGLSWHGKEHFRGRKIIGWELSGGC